MEIHIYVATDTHGNKVKGVVGDVSDNLFLSGLKDTEGEHHTFESEAYHAGSWADDFGFSLVKHTIKLDLESESVTQWIVDWPQEECDMEEGDDCPDETCDGKMIFVSENCSCHISAPCSACTDSHLACEKCGTEEPS